MPSARRTSPVCWPSVSGALLYSGGVFMSLSGLAARRIGPATAWSGVREAAEKRLRVGEHFVDPI
jgi:hypothetical protein